MNNKTENSNVFKGLSMVLFVTLFIYILIRIIFNEPLHDEVATYMFYFYQGNYWGESIHWDANNHLLNSFLGHQLYKLFGDNFAILRLPNLISFVLYFFGTVQLTKGLKTKYLNIIGLLALNTIPFFLEYFGNARGYGLSMGFFIWGIVHCIHFLKTRKLSRLVLTYAFLICAIASNLTIVNSSLIILGTIVLSSFLPQNKGAIKPMKEWLLHIAFIIVVTPFVLFGFALKEAGALYYGSLDGIWDVTGKTLSKYTLFYDADWLQFAYLAIFIVLIGSGIRYVLKTKQTEWFKEPTILYLFLFFGNLVAILAMAFLLKVYYPEDRVGMYLIPLFLLVFLNFIDSIKIGKWLQFSLLFFPISMLFHLSIHTSVFSPDDRFNDEFYAEVKAQIKPENTIQIYRIMNWCWPYNESHEKNKSSVALFYNENSTLSDILITKTTELKNLEILKLYDTIAHYKPSTHIAFKRKKPLERDSLYTISQNDIVSQNEYFDIAAIEGGPYIHKNLVVQVSGHLKTIENKNALMLVIQSNERYLYYSFETTYQSQLINDDFLHNFVIENVESEEKEIKVYLWNRKFHKVELTNIETTIFELKDDTHGTR